MNLVYVVIFMFFQSLIHSQGTVIEHGESRFLIRYETSEIGNSNELIHTIDYSCSDKKIDIKINLSVIDEDKYIEALISG